jgi:CubicO group peptidase (beta-lactamase class C family)
MVLSDHTSALPLLPDAARLREGWGFGWRLQRLGDGGWYGSAVPSGAFGHAGGEGTVAWADPASGLVLVLLTNGQLDLEGDTLKACGNIAAAALCGAA